MKVALPIFRFRCSIAWTAAIVGAGFPIFALKLRIAYVTFGTNDMTAWQRFASIASQRGGAELYLHEALFNHPPFMVHVLQFLVYLTHRTGVPFPFWLRLPANLADSVTVILVWKTLTPRPEEWGRRGALLLLAVAPPLIMISAFHGNTDPAMICFVVLTVFLIDRRASAVVAGVVFGMALNIKVVPVIFIPAIVFYLSTWRARLTFCVVAAATWCGASMPYLVEVPWLILRQSFGYTGNYGQWGISQILVLRAAHVHPGAPWSELNHGEYVDIGRIITVTGIIAAAAWMNRSTSQKPRLFVQCGLVISLFLTTSPAFGVQYLAWLMPWVVALGFRATLALYTASSLFLFQVYTFWAGGFPWYFADSPRYGWHGRIIGLDLLTWACVAAILLCYIATIWKMQRGAFTEADVEEHILAHPSQ